MNNEQIQENERQALIKVLSMSIPDITVDTLSIIHNITWDALTVFIKLFCDHGATTEEEVRDLILKAVKQNVDDIGATLDHNDKVLHFLHKYGHVFDEPPILKQLN